ncbi:phosphate signaling complex protein PhoU [Halorubrum vacuolatum]|uniref:Phosphate-specific transport system accessory protein PhoU n=1 Tax=Halorubrum vacuolatum TaxID=63740 RepID=A0A238UUL9_HALVU|nr:phosphate signaling complex protein PhoU [Halorubrum vacuolatum]SNR25900.1 phosphate transport system protein [Halorubrum vacuolatum]
MPREEFQRQLDTLRDDVVAMGDLVLTRYDEAIEAAATGDSERAQRVIEGDADVNERYLELEERCTQIIALQQPVAGDLRLVTASFKIITDLERIADLATNLAGYGHPDRGIHPDIDVRDLAGDAGEMVAMALEAYEDEDPEACFTVADRDDALDERCERASKRVVRGLLDAQATRTQTVDRDDAFAAGLDEVSRALLTVRDLERVGDHAVNIAARTLYMIETDDALLY